MFNRLQKRHEFNVLFIINGINPSMQTPSRQTSFSPLISSAHIIHRNIILLSNQIGKDTPPCMKATIRKCEERKMEKTEEIKESIGDMYIPGHRVLFPCLYLFHTLPEQNQGHKRKEGNVKHGVKGNETHFVREAKKQRTVAPSSSRPSIIRPCGNRPDMTLLPRNLALSNNVLPSFIIISDFPCLPGRIVSAGPRGGK